MAFLKHDNENLGSADLTCVQVDPIYILWYWSHVSYVQLSIPSGTAAHVSCVQLSIVCGTATNISSVGSRSHEQNMSISHFVRLDWQIFLLDLSRHRCPVSGSCFVDIMKFPDCSISIMTRLGTDVNGPRTALEPI